jgi:O-antigen ligase
MTIKRIRKESIAFFCFWLIITIVFLNLNGILNMFTGVSQLFSPIILILCIVLIIICISNGIIGILQSDSFKLYFLFLISYLLIGLIVKTYSLLYTQDNEVENLWLNLFNGATNALLVFTLVIYASYSSKLNEKRDLLSMFNNIVTVSCIISIIMMYLGVATLNTEGDNDRAAGLFGNPNIAGLVANIGVILNFTFFVSRPTFFRLLALIACLIVSFFSFSRVSIINSVFAIIAFVIVMVYRTIQSNKNNKSIILNKKSKLFYMAFFLSVISFIIIFFSNLNNLVLILDPGQVKRIESLLSLLGGEISTETTANRSDTFTQAGKLIIENPIVGYGVGYFENLRYDAIDEIVRGVHNSYIAIFGNAGFFPLICFLAFIGHNFFMAISRNGNRSLVHFMFILCLALFLATSHNFLDEKILIVLYSFVIILATKQFQLLRVVKKNI